ncbi:MAG: hypothetical protein ACRDI2_12165 [Chloroflexota bacterium]
MDTRLAAPDAVSVSLEPALRRLDEIARLEADWDTYGGLSPTAEALETARHIITAVAEQLGASVGKGSLPYDIAPIANGGVGLEWQGQAGSLEVWISPGGGLGYLLNARQGNDRAFTEAEQASAAEVIGLLRQVLRA